MELKRITHDPNVRVRGLAVSFAPAVIKVTNGIVVKSGRPVGTLTKHFQLDPFDQDRTLACYVRRTRELHLAIGYGENKPVPPGDMVYKLFSGTIPAGKSVTGGTFTVKCEEFRPGQIEELPVETSSIADAALRQAGMAPVKTTTTEPPKTEETDENPDEDDDNSEDKTPDIPNDEDPDSVEKTDENPDEDDDNSEDIDDDIEPQDASEELVFPAIEELIAAGATTQTGRPTVDALREALGGYVTDEVNGEFRDLWWGKYEAKHPVSSE